MSQWGYWFSLRSGTGVPPVKTTRKMRVPPQTEPALSVGSSKAFVLCAVVKTLRLGGGLRRAIDQPHRHQGFTEAQRMHITVTTLDSYIRSGTVIPSVASAAVSWLRV